MFLLQEVSKIQRKHIDVIPKWGSHRYVNISSAHALKVSIKVFSYTFSLCNKSKYHCE